MKLPIPFIKGKRSDNAYYLALLLDDEKTSSVILEEQEGKVKIVGKHEEHLPSPIEHISQDELIAIVDKTISRAEEVLPPNVETHKTVFGVKESWVDKETKKIRKEYLHKLKKMSDALDLSPIGFMVISEAIANLLQNEEGAPLSGILVELGRKTIHVTLFRGGQISESVSGHVEHTPQVTVDTLLKRFTAPVLPAKIILAHTKDTKSHAQSFVHHEWSKSLPFLHVPQVDVLPEDFDLRAVAHGASQQMGFALLGIEKGTATEPKPEHKEHTHHDEHVSEEEAPVPIAAAAPVAGDNFGFVADKDITAVAKHAPAEPEHEAKTQEPEKDEVPTEPVHHPSLQHEAPADSPEAEGDFPSKSRRKNSPNILAGLTAALSSIKLPKNVKIPEALKRNKNVKLGILALGIILLLGIGLSMFYFRGVKAEVVLSVKPREVTETETVTFTTDSDSDFSGNIIAAKRVTIEVEGEITANATGKKDTGEKAKGTVTIFNSSNRPVDLTGGTTITSANNIVFTLDKDVRVASASGDIFTGTRPGTTQAAVTARDLGTEGNLPSGTRFTVGGNSTLAARNDSAFSGGSKKTITVVSRNDYAKLREELPESLEKKAADELSAKNTGGETVLPGFIKTSITEEEFDKDVDEEAKQVKLTGTVTFEGMSYKNSDLEEYDKAVLSEDADEVNFASGSLKNEVKNTKVINENEIQGTLTITAGLLPKINEEDVVNKLKGKSAGEAREILGTIPQVAESEIKYSPNILFLSRVFPRLPNDIIVSVKTE